MIVVRIKSQAARSEYSPRGRHAAQALRQASIQSSQSPGKGDTMAGAGEAERLRDVLTVTRLAGHVARNQIQV